MKGSIRQKCFRPKKVITGSREAPGGAQPVCSDVKFVSKSFRDDLGLWERIWSPWRWVGHRLALCASVSLGADSVLLGLVISRQSEHFQRSGVFWCGDPCVLQHIQSPRSYKECAQCKNMHVRVSQCVWESESSVSGGPWDGVSVCEFVVVYRCT